VDARLSEEERYNHAIRAITQKLRRGSLDARSVRFVFMALPSLCVPRARL
jgi:hypothetical protein